MYIKETEGLNLQPPIQIKFKNLTTDDFKMIPNVAIFLDNKELKSWLDSRLNLSFASLMVVTNIEDTFVVRVEPYIYKNGDDYYIIQNVIDNKFENAMTVAEIWFNHKINVGYDAPPIEELSVYKIYIPTVSGEFVIKLDSSQNETDFLEILDYGKDKYAAILPLKYI